MVKTKALTSDESFKAEWNAAASGSGTLIPDGADMVGDGYGYGMLSVS
jgi:hypothetical protein